MQTQTEVDYIRLVKELPHGRRAGQQTLNGNLNQSVQGHDRNSTNLLTENVTGTPLFLACSNNLASLVSLTCVMCSARELSEASSKTLASLSKITSICHFDIKYTCRNEPKTRSAENERFCRRPAEEQS